MKYKKKLLWINSCKPKYVLANEKQSFSIIKKNLLNEQSELKYLSNFRKKNQTRFYKKCEAR